MTGAFTFKDARNHVFRDVRRGASPDSELVKTRINQAMAKGLATQYAAGSYNVWQVRTHVAARELLLPPEIETAELVRAGNSSILVGPQWYTFTSRVVCVDHEFRTDRLELEDLGDGHIHDQQLCEPQMILAMVERHYGHTPKEDENLSIHVQGLGPDDRPVWDTSGRPGFSLPLIDSCPTYSQLGNRSICVKRITHVSKPETKWPVVLYGYKGATTEEEMQEGSKPVLTQIARLMPWETTISRRKYRFLGAQCVPEVVEVFGRLRYRPLKYDNDVLPIQNLESVRELVMAIEAEHSGKIDEANYFHARGQKSMDDSLDKSLGNSASVAAAPLIDDGGHNYGDIQGFYGQGSRYRRHLPYQ